jgi:hypothetical protein
MLFILTGVSVAKHTECYNPHNTQKQYVLIFGLTFSGGVMVEKMVEYLPVFVTAFAGIFGVVINVSVNTWYRREDKRNARHLQSIQAYEAFYQPLQLHVQRVSRTIKLALSTVESPDKINTVIGYLCGTANIPPTIAPTIEAIKNEVAETVAFLGNNAFQVFGDYELKRALDSARLTIDSLNNAVIHTSTKPPDVSTTEYDNLDRQITKAAIRLYSPKLLSFFWQRVKNW